MQVHQAAALRAAFDQNSHHYDPERRMLVPCFDDFYGTAVRAAAEGTERGARILDLGAGTAMFTRMLADAIPQADCTVVDLSPEMLQQAQQALAKRTQSGEEFRYVQADYSDPDFPARLPHARYDLVASALSIHHLDNADKTRLFGHVRSVLKPGGRFVNADQALGANAWFSDMQERWWLEDVEATTLPREAIAASRGRRTLDRNAGIPFQLEALREAGFANADTPYRNGLFAVFVAF